MQDGFKIIVECIMNTKKGYKKAHSTYNIFQEQLRLTKWQQSFTFSASPLLIAQSYLQSFPYFRHQVFYLLERENFLTLGNKNSLSMICQLFDITVNWSGTFSKGMKDVHFQAQNRPLVFSFNKYDYYVLTKSEKE